MENPIITDAQAKLRALQAEGFVIANCTLEKDGRKCKVFSDGNIEWDAPPPARSWIVFAGIFMVSIAVIATPVYAIMSAAINSEIAGISNQVRKHSAKLELQASEIKNQRVAAGLPEVFASCKEAVAEDVRGFVQKKRKPVEGRPGKFYIGASTAAAAENMLDKGVLLCQQVFFEQTKLLSSIEGRK